MGIRHLNKHLLKHCPRSIQYISLETLRDKTISVDINNYLYQFSYENKIRESIESMIHEFNNYSIELIFVFDGKPPPEKMETLNRRKQMKMDAQTKYRHLLENAPENEAELEKCRVQMTRVNSGQIEIAKKTIRDNGSSYVESPQESDQICVDLVNSGKCWACMSQDMDMLAYGCRRVIRKFHNDYHLYDYAGILKELRMTEKVFRQILVLSGTDYNPNEETNLLDTLSYYRQYARSPASRAGDFYQWLVSNTSYIKNLDHLQKCCSMFDCSSGSVSYVIV